MVQRPQWPGIATASFIALTLAIIAWTGIVGPLWNAWWEAKPADWLGFAGNIAAGLMTICAALLLGSPCASRSPPVSELRTKATTRQCGPSKVNYGPCSTPST